MMRPRMPAGRISVELLLGISSALLSLGVLVVTIVQTGFTRQQLYAAAWPYLQHMTYVSEKEVKFAIKNKGIGPALVRHVELSYRGKSYRDHLSLFQTEAKPLHGRMGVGSLAAGDVLQAGEESRLFSITSDDSVVPVRAIRDDRAFAMKVTYSDVYGKCWVLDTERVTELPGCPD